ncbi:MAG: helix-turn-helix transcriptional regulator [Thiobacillus sp.]
MTTTPTSNTPPASGYASANTLAAMLETTPSTIWRWSKKGRLPKPYRLGEGTTRWKIEEVNEALAKLAA